MAKLIAMYKRPLDTTGFDKYYFEKHVPLAKTIPGLRGYEVSTGTVATPGGPSDWHLIAFLEFDSMAAIQAAISSPEGRATASDLGNFAQAGVELLVCDTKTI